MIWYMKGYRRILCRIFADRMVKYVHKNKIVQREEKFMPDFAVIVIIFAVVFAAMGIIIKLPDKKK